jgi:MFS family permease
VETARVTSAYDGIARLTTLIGGPAGGLVIAWLGSPRAILINAVSFALCSLITAVAVRVPSTPEPGSAEPTKEPYLRALAGGVAFVWRDRLMFGVIAMLFVTNMCNQAHNVFIPLWVREILHSPAALGLIPGAFALGALLGNVAMTALVTRIPRYATLVLGYLIGGAPRFLVFGLSDQLSTVVVVTFLAGIAMSSVNPIIGAMIMDRTPSTMQARVFGLCTAVAWGGIPLGGLLGGWAADTFGIGTAAIAAGCAYFAATLTPVFGANTWRKLDEKPTSESGPGMTDGR